MPCHLDNLQRKVALLHYQTEDEIPQLRQNRRQMLEMLHPRLGPYHYVFNVNQE